MNETEILKYCSTKHDSKGRFLAKLVREDIYNDILKISPTLKHIKRNNAITAFYSGYREIPICLHDDCNNFTNWRPTLLNFSQYCCTKCSNSDPKKDATTVKNNLVKYGVPRASMTEESKAKLLETNLERFGCISSAQHQSVKDKALATNLERYGHVATEVGNVTNLEHYNDKDFITKNFIKDGMFLKNEFMEYFTCSQVAAHATLNRLGIEYKKYSSIKKSGIERKIEKFLVDHNIKFIYRYREYHLELDFYLPDYKIGLEIDGLYFHSYNGLNSFKPVENYMNKHVLKFNHFNTFGINTIFIWENEILNEDKFKNWELHLLETLNLRKVENIDITNIVISYTEDFYKVFNFVKKYSFESVDLIGKWFKLEYNNEVIGYIFTEENNFDKILNFVVNKNLISENLKIEILIFLSKKYNVKFEYSMSLRHGRHIRYLNYKYILEHPNHFIMNITKNISQLDQINAKLNSFENISDEENYATVYDFNLSYYDNLKLNGFSSIWDCGNIKFIIGENY